MKSKLRILRVLCDKTQYQLSFETGIPQSRISLLENKLADAKPEEKALLAEVFKTKADELFD